MPDNFQNTLANEPPSRASSTSSGNAADCLYLLILAAVVGAFIFSFLSIDTERHLIFDHFGYPSVPSGRYARVRVLSSSLERSFLSPDKYVVTVQRTGGGDQNDPGFPAGAILYTLECVPHFWNLCAALNPGDEYFARWVSGEHQELAIVEPQTDHPKQIDPRKTRRFDVRGWKQTSE